MVSVSVCGSILYFRNHARVSDYAPAPGSAETLMRREMAERAAAKRSPTLAGRRAHQELAKLLHAARKEIEAADGLKGRR